MSTPVAILKEMDMILDKLIKTAEELCHLSKKGAEEEDFTHLQKVQDSLVTTLMELDDAFVKVCQKNDSKIESALRKSIDRKVEQFQKLNQHFIENIS